MRGHFSASLKKFSDNDKVKDNKMTVFELHQKISEICPKSLSCFWDNDGIMVSHDLSADVRRVLVSLDATNEAVRFAAENGFDTVVTHHPMIFKGVKNVCEANLPGKRVISAIKSGVSVMSFHTRLDVCDGGVNDALCDRLGLNVVGKFGDEETPELCRIADTEIISSRELAIKVKERLGCDFVRLNGNPDKPVSRIGVCGGDGKDFVYPAIIEGCDAFITGDAGYNMCGDAAEDGEGLVTIEVGHYHSEAPICDVLAELVRKIAGDDISVEIYNSCTYTVI